MMHSLQTTKERVALGKCTVYSAQTGNFCDVDGEHDIHEFTTPNGVTYKSKPNN